MNLICYQLLFLVSYVINANLAQKDSDVCMTPDGKRGECIRIRDCQTLMQLLARPRPLPQNIINFLRESQCGFEGLLPIVCCPYSRQPTQGGQNVQVLQNSEKERPFFQEEFVRDVSQHPHLRTLLPRACGVLIIDDKITNGNISSLFEYPWMALLGYTSGHGVQFRCGGTLINRRYVLTAAHCLTSPSGYRLVRVRLGEYDLSSERDCQENVGCAPPVQEYGIEDVIPHPAYYVPEQKNDIGLIRLNQDVEFNDAVRPVCLPIGLDQQTKNLEGEKVTVTGWGATEIGTNSPILLKVSLPVMPLSKCARIYNASVPIGVNQICAGGTEGKDSCTGDSGGPLQSLIQRFDGPVVVQYGIVSLGPRGCGTPGWPGVYTKVGHYMEWILDTMRL